MEVPGREFQYLGTLGVSVLRHRTGTSVEFPHPRNPARLLMIGKPPNPIWHQVMDFSRLVGLRDRLRCPYCDAVGTWKPHGGWLDFADQRKVRRWLCKFCGAYRGPEGFRQALSGPEAWYLPEVASSEIGVQGKLPSTMLYWEEQQKWINPWYG